MEVSKNMVVPRDCRGKRISSCVIAMGSVGWKGLSCTATPAYRNWLGLINEFVSFGPNHKPSLTTRIYT